MDLADDDIGQVKLTLCSNFISTPLCGFTYKNLMPKMFKRSKNRRQINLFHLGIKTFDRFRLMFLQFIHGYKQWDDTPQRS